jgi:hypothetical protein
MRTENVDGSYIESERLAPDPEDPDRCGFCKRNPAHDIRRILYSRNGRQEYPLVICVSCRVDLVEHLSQW